jgi:hypothetical protein
VEWKGTMLEKMNMHKDQNTYIFELPSKFLMLKVERVVVIAQLF